ISSQVKKKLTKGATENEEEDATDDMSCNQDQEDAQLVNVSGSNNDTDDDDVNFKDT
ncbi:hypothetical protein HAX54_046447, partial [Datura stramonium]|nr:hypothetical protein [Datura stramonium]